MTENEEMAPALWLIRLIAGYVATAACFVYGPVLAARSGVALEPEFVRTWLNLATAPAFATGFFMALVHARFVR
jgi:hypothetical protein